MEQKIKLAADWLRSADALLITAGAGIGIDSGLPDFRGKKGFWAAYPGLAHSGTGFRNIANPRSFIKDSRKTWGFYGHRLQLYRKTEPHEGFSILQEFGRSMASGAFVYTSNIDGQFLKAGFKEEQIVECHGSLHYFQYHADCSSRIWRDDQFDPIIDDATCQLLSDLPTCPDCGSLARPNVLMFDDWNWQSSRTELQEHRLETWLEKVTKLVVIEIGAGTAILTVRRKGEALRGQLIRINPHESRVGRANAVGITGGALSTLKLLQAELSSSPN